MSYQVIARKWRPQNFDEMVGQEAVTRTLKNALTNNRIAHAFLFSGVRGVGKTTAARILAKALNCSKGITEKPCDDCDSCNEIRNGNCVDVQEIDAASNRGIDDIRELRESARYGTARDRFKIFIIDEPMVGLDPRGVRLVKDLFSEMPRSRGMSVFLSTHTLAVAEEICTLLTIIHKGKIIASDTPRNIKESIARTGGNLEQAFLKLTGHDDMESLKGSLGVNKVKAALG